jgi:hypothetical protein
VLYERVVLESTSPQYHLPFPVVAIYPKEGTFWSDHPIGVVEREWVTPEHREAAKVYIDYLLARPQQERALQLALLTPALRESQTATLKIFRQRLENQERTEQTLKEVDADLARFEAQVDLALENASMRDGGAVVSANLELASRILDDEKAFGDWDDDVAAVDRAFAPPPVVRSALPPREATKR